MANAYELVTIFRVTGDEYKNGLAAVKKVLSEMGGNISSDEDMNDRELAYSINKESRGHYHLFNFTIDPLKLVQLDENLKLTKHVLRSLVVKK